jgi:hypothetical protein
VAQGAARRARSLAVGEHAQQAGGLAVRRRNVLIVGDVDDPVAAADRQAGERHDVTGVELALRARAVAERNERREAAGRNSESSSKADARRRHGR